MLDLLGASRRLLREFWWSAGDLPGRIVLHRGGDPAHQLSCRHIQLEHRQHFLIRVHYVSRRRLLCSGIGLAYQLPRGQLLSRRFRGGCPVFGRDI